jgi:glycine/D-amino acid oxidase-like deaminating enzyme
MPLATTRPQGVVVVGAGLVGLTTAWLLSRQGHRVTLLDPALAGTPQPTSGSSAALGLLMAQVFHRSSGRAWRLRQQSLALWRSWLGELGRRGHPLPCRQGLLLLAANASDLERQQRLAADKARLGIELAPWGTDRLADLRPALPGAPLGGLLSQQDGQIDPGAVMAALLAEARQAGLVAIADSLLALERGGRWRLHLAAGGSLQTPWLVLAAGLGSAPPLAGLVPPLAMQPPLALQPVLGQALELELAEAPRWNWPGAVVWRGLNLVPRPDLPGGRRLWLGATLEPGIDADAAALADLRQLGGDAPSWLRQARVVRQWQGLRCQPLGRPAPLLEQPEPGLLLACGHHRNGVLLAPASAAWIGQRIEAG